MQTAMDRTAAIQYTRHGAAESLPMTFSQGAVAGELQQLEAQGLALCQADMKQLRDQFSLWYFELEDTDPDTADVHAVLTLLESAPNAFARGMVFGKFTLRMQIAALTGRGF
jgi:hypothetical protein